MKGNNKLTSFTLGLDSISDDFFVGSGLTGTLTLPNATSIGSNSFKGNNLSGLDLPLATTVGNNSFKNNLLTTVTLPKVTSIGNNAFENNKLTNLALPEATTVGNSSFSGNLLASVTIPKATTIGSSAFYNNKLTSINLPKVTSLGYRAFGNNEITRVELDSYEYNESSNNMYTSPFVKGERDEYGQPITYLKFKNRPAIIIEKGIIRYFIDDNCGELDLIFSDGTKGNRVVTADEKIIVDFTGAHIYSLTQC